MNLIQNAGQVMLMSCRFTDQMDILSIRVVGHSLEENAYIRVASKTKPDFILPVAGLAHGIPKRNNFEFPGASGCGNLIIFPGLSI
jgi:hypothetical protein